VIAFLATRLAYALTRRYDGKPDGRDGFRWGQIFSSSLVALAHGTNDAQKTMGVITLTLVIAGWQSASDTEPQTWVIFACAATIALGTYVGGWRIIRTLGKGLTEIKPAQGFAAETSTAATILSSSALGFALSTTQVASGSVNGSGLGRRGSKVRWRTAGRIGVGWLLTLPASATVSGLAALIIVWLGPWGIAVDTVLAVATVLFIYLRSRRNAVTAANAMSEVADSGLAVKVKRNPPPTRRQRAIMREEARRRAAVEARERAKRKAQTKAEAQANKNSGDRSDSEAKK
jgi:PiT family inorganic phosphate transporter